MEELLKQLIQEVRKIKGNMATKQELAEVKQTVTRMENTMSDKFVGGLFDAREVQFDVNERILSSLDRIESKIGKHDLKISILDKTKSNRRKVK